MPEVLRIEVDPAATRTLLRPDAVLDPATRETLDTAVAEARTRAFHAGEVSGRAAAASDAERAADRVVAAVRALHDEVSTQRAAAVRASLDLATAVAAAVLDRTPPDDALAIVERVAAALDGLDEDPLEVRVHPSMESALRSVDDPRVRVVADPSLDAGDARVVGSTCGAELTRQALLDAALELLGEVGR